eukprot:m.222561 g.222561  ORF g.222561 m.222561 type:complete len:102 (+) comp16055_c0_seq1:427-732(+)
MAAESTGSNLTKKALAFETMTLRDDERKFRPLDVLPGIGPVAKERLAKIGFTTLAHVIGQFLLFSCDRELMNAWLKEHVELQDRHITSTVDALASWCDRNL